MKRIPLQLQQNKIAIPDIDAMKGKAAWLYSGSVMHARMKPKTHRFNYRVFSLLIDIDKLEDANNTCSIFSVNKPGIVAFYEKDHGRRDGTRLRPYIEQLLERKNIASPKQILLWCNPRIAGYTFNPLSVYFCYDDNGEICALVYQVHNTFGESHSYVAQATLDNENSASIRQSATKRFYVSPFLDMNLRYDFRINPPSETLKIRILECDPDGPILAATFNGNRIPLVTTNLLLGILQTAGLTWKITAGIHYEAIKLWLKGIKLRPRPAPPSEASYLEVKGEN